MTDDPGPWSAIPEELKARRQWVIWREEERDGKPTKVPYQARRPQSGADSTKPSTWATFIEAVAAAELANGIGYVFAEDDPYVGVDFDQVDDEVREDIRILNSYTERSQSGRGFHVIVRGRLNTDRNRKGHFEVYERGRYFVMTGKALKAKNISPRIEERQAELDALVKKRLSDTNGNGLSPAPVRPLDMSDHELVKKMLESKSGPQIRALLAGDTSAYASASEADAALCCHLAFWTGNDFDRILRLAQTSGLYREKWNRADYAEKTINSAISRTAEVYSPPTNVFELHGVPTSTPEKAQDAPETSTHADSPFIDWPRVWGHEDSAEWVFEDVLAKGRGHAVYAGHKVGKSLICLYMAASIATSDEKVVVIYLDYEMTLSDVVERMEDMGFGPHADLSRLKYALIPTLPPLDTPHGSLALMAMVDSVQGEYPEHHVIVIVDTVSRAVQGEENSADTFRDFYRHTGMELKRRGITWARLDHGGKDDTKGQRGSSAKGDDVDVVWQLKKTQNGVMLQRDVARMAWVPEKVTFKMSDSPLRYERVAGDWPAGTLEASHALDRCGVPVGASVKVARAALADAGEGRRTLLVSAAQRYRRELSERGR